MSESKVNELMDLINDEDIMKDKKSDKLDKLLEELSKKKTPLKIKAKGRFTCMICSKKFLKGDEKVDLECCDCLQSVHNSCLNKKMNQAYYLQCYSCDISMKYTNLKRMQNNSIIIEPPNEDLKRMKNKSMIETTEEERKSKNNERNSFDNTKSCALCNKQKGVFTLTCPHFLCRTCLKNYISQIAEDQKLYDQMRCPNLMCNSQIFKKEFNEFLMKDEEIGHIVKEIQQKKNAQKEESQEYLLEMSKGPDERIAGCSFCNEKFLLDYRSPYLSGASYKCNSCNKEGKVVSSEKNAKIEKSCFIY